MKVSQMNRTRLANLLKSTVKVLLIASLILGVQYAVGLYVTRTFHATANWAEYYYASVAVIGIVTYMVVMKLVWGDLWFARKEEREHPGTHRGEVIVSTGEAVRFGLAIFGLLIIAYLGIKGMTNPPSNPNTPIPPFAVEVAIGFSTLVFILVLKPITVLIERGLLDSANKEEAEREKQAQKAKEGQL